MALALFGAAALFAVRTFGSIRATPGTLGGPRVLAVPPRGEVAPDFLPDGRPIFIVHHQDGTVSVVDAFSNHRPWGFEELVVWCPSNRQFVEWAHEAHFDEHGRWVSAGPAPSGLATFGFAVVSRDADGDPASIRVGAMQAPDQNHSPPETEPQRPPVCPEVAGRSNAIVTHRIEPSQTWDTPADAVSAAPAGWIAVRGTLLVSPEDGFVQLCAQIRGQHCVDGAVVRGIDGIRLLVNVLRPSPGSAYEKPTMWLARVRDGMLDDTAIAGFLQRS